MRFSNIDYTVVYVDPSRGGNGNGTTPANALNALPASISSIADNTCYVVRRTAEAKSCQLPSGTNSGLRNLMIVGMPMASDEAWDLMPQEARTAWGSDTALYANVRMATANGSFQMPNVEQFVLHRVHLFRDNVDANAWILRLDNANQGVACVSIRHCRFGARGIDVDRPTYQTVLAANRLTAYVHVQYARVLSIRDCTLNHAVAGYSSYGDGIYCRWSDIVHVEDVRVFSPAWTNSSQSWPLRLSDEGNDGVECIVRNVSQTIRLNGASGQYVPTLLSVKGYISLTLDGITVATGTPLAAAKPSSYQAYYSCVSVEEPREMTMRNVDMEYSDCWDCNAPVLNINRAEFSSYVPGVSKGLRNVSVTMARENGIGQCCTYANAMRDGYSHAVVQASFSSGSGPEVKTPCADGLVVKAPRCKALYGEGLRITDAEFEGAVHLKGCIADIRSITTWFPGAALNLYDGSHARVRRIACNTENDVYPYNEDPAIGTDFDDRGNAYVDESNTPLRPMACLPQRSEHIYLGFGCGSEGADGHFAYRCANGVCDTWSVHREGGGASALKLSNNACPTGGTMVLGRRPFNGMQLLPATTGRHVLRAHVALKGFARPEEIYRQLVVSAEVGGRTLYSTTDGRWADDPSSVWVNDSELTQLVLEMPLDVAEVAPVDVRVCYSWYASGGFVYLDPNIELEVA